MFLMFVREINWGMVATAAGLMAGVALILGLLIILVSRIFAIKADSRITDVAGLLPGANCGGCGFAGCQALAEAIVKGEADIDACSVCSKTAKIEIAQIMGLSYAGGEETMAVVACAGGVNCNDKYVYQGYGNCISQIIMAGGRKECPEGCMGTGSCVDACSYFALEVVDGVAKVDPAQCISCGACIKACPKKIIKRIPKSAKVYVACSTTCRGKEVMQMCSAGCISCGLCVRNCPEGAIQMKNNVAIIDYRKCTGCKTCVEKCPRHIIREL